MTQPQTPLSDEELIAYFENALPPEARAALEERLAADPEARAKLEDWGAQDAAIRALYGTSPDAPVPERLTDVLRVPAAPRPVRAPLRLAAMLALLAIGGTGGWVSHAWLGPEAGATQLAEAALTAHGTYVVEVVHPVEVPASQREHLDTWMSKRMGTQMRPPDLAASGFALMGGRILPSEDGPAGLYMYENADGKRITLYVSPQRDKADSAFEYAGHGTTQSLYWKDGGLGYAVVGDMPRDRLRDLAIEAYDQML